MAPRMIMRPPGPGTIGTPVINSRWKYLLDIPTVKDAFAHRLRNQSHWHIDSTNAREWKATLAGDLSKDKYISKQISVWLTRCACVEYGPNEAVDVGVDALWLIFLDKKTEALDLLSHTQQIFFRKNWPKNNLVGNEVDSDYESEREDAAIHAPEVRSTDIGSPLDYDTVLEGFSTRQQDQLHQFLTHANQNQLIVCHKWAGKLESFFNETSSNAQELSDVVAILRLMKAVRPSVYLTRAWVQAVKVSGLDERIATICNPGTHLERSNLWISQSYRSHSWKESIGQVLQNWTAALTGSVLAGPAPYAHERTDNCEQAALVMYLSKDNCIVPTASHPGSAFFLLSEKNFTQAWDHWLKDSLIEQGVSVQSWNINQVYQRIRSIELDKYDTKHPDSPMHPKLRLLLELTQQHKHRLNEIEQFAFRPPRAELPDLAILGLQEKTIKKSSRKKKKNVPTDLSANLTVPGGMNRTNSQSRVSSAHTSGRSSRRGSVEPDEQTLRDERSNKGCSRCSSLPLDQHCRYYIEVDERDPETLEGLVLTCTDDPSDRLPPLKRKGSSPTKPIFRTPQELGLRRLAHRPEVKARCGSDSIILVDSRTKKLVGAVRFDAFSPTSLQDLKVHHTSISKFKPLKRGSLFQNWEYGNMTAIGSRVPQGGRPGDAYTMYPNVDGETKEEIEALFHHAFAADALRTVAKSIGGLVTVAINETDRQFPDMNKLGKSGDNLYSCTDYTAPQHSDNDTGIGLCCQLVKNAALDEYGFAYSQWGCFIETRENTAWQVLWYFIAGTFTVRLCPEDRHWNPESGAETTNQEYPKAIMSLQQAETLKKRVNTARFVGTIKPGQQLGETFAYTKRLPDYYTLSFVAMYFYSIPS